jgi:hypothetical protein
MTPRGIAVTIPRWDLVSGRRDMLESMIIGRLRDAGIPVKGVLIFRGVSEGTLYETMDFQGNMVYNWISEDAHA